MSRLLEEITLVLGVDAKHLNELRWTWPTWVRFKPEILQMPAIVFFDALQVEPKELDFLDEHKNLRLLPWDMPMAGSQREKMLTGFVHVPAQEVETKWFLKLDTDVLATGPGLWLKEQWFSEVHGQEPVFISARWGYSKPRYVMDLLNDWADRVPELAKFPRLNLPYSSEQNLVRHKRIISWIFFGQTRWVREAGSWLDPSGRLPYPSQDSFLFYCARRSQRRYVRENMAAYQWYHGGLNRIRERAIRLELENSPALPAQAAAPRVCSPTPAQAGGRGVIYYNAGEGCTTRLLVSLHSLRRHYHGPVTILSEDEASHRLCRPIAAAYGAEFREWNCGVPAGVHRNYLAKTRYHLGSPFDTTIALDTDTLVTGPIDELFQETEQGEFCVAHLANWKTTGRGIAKRIMAWSRWLPDYINGALHFGPAINCGVIAFRKDSALMKDWHELALPGRASFIPDEVCCQVILHRYPHRIIADRWNSSCKYGHPEAPETRIVHFHGRKHCRPGLPFHGHLWAAEFEKVMLANVANVRNWRATGDRMLKRYLRERESDEVPVVARD